MNIQIFVSLKTFVLKKCVFQFKNMSSYFIEIEPMILVNHIIADQYNVEYIV